MPDRVPHVTSITLTKAPAGQAPPVRWVCSCSPEDLHLTDTYERAMRESAYHMRHPRRTEATRRRIMYARATLVGVSAAPLLVLLHR